MAGTYLSLVILSVLILLCIEPSSNIYDWYVYSGVRLAFAKILQLSVFAINLLSTILICLGIHWMGVHRRRHIVRNGGCMNGILIYFVIWQAIITVFYALVVFYLQLWVNWLPATITGITAIQLPFLSALSGSESFCEVFGRSAEHYFLETAQEMGPDGPVTHPFMQQSERVVYQPQGQGIY